MIPGYPFSELSQLNNDFIRLDGTYSHIMVQRRVIQYSYRYALAVFESLAAPGHPRQRLLFALEVWQKCRWTGYWRRFSSMRIQRKYVPMLQEILAEFLVEDPEVLQRQGVDRMRAELAKGEIVDFRDPIMQELPLGFVES